MIPDFKASAFDRAICAIAPQTGIRRLAAKRILHEFRYDGARSDSKRGSAPANMSPNSFDVQRDRLQLMREAEDMERNFAPAKMLNRKVAMYCTPQSYHATTGDSKLDAEVEEYLNEEAFPNCDVTGRYDFFKMLEFGVMGCNRGGDYGWAFQRPGSFAEMEEGELIQLPLKIQAIEPDRIGGIYQNVVADNYVSGLTIGEFGQIEAFRVFHRSMTTNSYTDPIDVPSSQFVHLTDPMRIDQYRGVSILATAIQNLRDLYEMMDFVKGKAKLASAITVFTNSNGAMAGSGAMDPYATNLFDGGAAGLQQDIQFGQINHLAGGTDIKFPASNSPSNEEQWLMTQLLKFTAMSYDLPYSFALDASALGGVSSRLESEMAKASFERFQKVLKPHADRMKNAFLMDAVAKGIFPVSAIRKITKGRWGYRPHPQPDLGKEASAAVNLYQTGLLDPMKYWMENSQDPEDVARAMGRWHQIKEKVAEEVGAPMEDIFGSGPAKPTTATESYTENNDPPGDQKKKDLSSKRMGMKSFDFDESKHPRADDGKFGSGSSASGEKKKNGAISISEKQKTEYDSHAKNGDEKAAQSVLDSVLKSNGYAFHRGKDPQNSRDIVQFADDPASNEHYGENQWVIHESDLHDIPDYVADYAENYFGDRDIINPSDIVDSAGAWDDRQFVSDLWQEFGDRFESEGIIGFKTNDGAVVFPGYGKEEGVIPANAIEYNKDGSPLSIEERFKIGHAKSNEFSRKEFKESYDSIIERIKQSELELKDLLSRRDKFISDTNSEYPSIVLRARNSIDRINVDIADVRSDISELRERAWRRDSQRAAEPTEEDVKIREKKKDERWKRRSVFRQAQQDGFEDNQAWAIAYGIIDSGKFSESRISDEAQDKLDEDRVSDRAARTPQEKAQRRKTRKRR